MTVYEGMTVYWGVLAAAIIISVGGQTLLKAGAGEADIVAQLLDVRTLFGLFLYGVAALLYIVALRRIPMSVALPCTAFSYVAATLIGHFGFAEPLGAMHLGALALICAGVVMLALA
jgi:small multidrug resistance pump